MSAITRGGWEKIELCPNLNGVRLSSDSVRFRVRVRFHKDSLPSMRLSLHIDLGGVSQEDQSVRIDFDDSLKLDAVPHDEVDVSTFMEDVWAVSPAGVLQNILGALVMEKGKLIIQLTPDGIIRFMLGLGHFLTFAQMPAENLRTFLTPSLTPWSEGLAEHLVHRF